MLCKLVGPYALLPCLFAWNDIRLGNDIPAAFLGSCSGWGSLERYAWVHTINIGGMAGTEGRTVVGTVRSIHTFVEDVDSAAGSRRQNPDLVDVWVGIDGVFHGVFIRSSTSSPFPPSSTSSSSTSSSALSTTSGLSSLCILFHRSWWWNSEGCRWSGGGRGRSCRCCSGCGCSGQ